MRTVLILTAGYGEGHRAAARGLKEGLDLLGEVRAEILDLFAPAFGALYHRTRRAYMQGIHQPASFWTSAAAALNRFPYTGQLLRCLWPLKKALTQALSETRPAAVISTFPAYAHLVRGCAREAGLRDLKSFVLVTDSLVPSPLWIQCDADAFLLPNEDTSNALRDRGLSPDRIFVSGFPVSPKFAAQSEARPEPGAGVRPRVVYRIDGQPGRAIPLVERLLREDKTDLTVLAGRDEGLLKALEEVAEHVGRPLNALGWVSDMPQLLRRNHLLIGRAGGTTIQEALAAQIPMLMNHIPQGPAEGSARLLLQNGCGAHCPTNEAVFSVLDQLFSKGALGWQQMHRHACALSRPDAAITTARWIGQKLKKTAPPQASGFGMRPGK